MYTKEKNKYETQFETKLGRKDNQICTCISLTCYTRRGYKKRTFSWIE